MLKIEHVKVYDLEESVIACRNAMRLKVPEYTQEEFEKSLERAKKLVQASKNGVVKCHDNFLTGIRVSFDVTYPQYWTPEFQRYHFADIVTSSSKMHRLVKMDLNSASNKYVSRDIIAYVNGYIQLYNHLLEEKEQNSFIGHRFTLRDGTVIKCDNVEDALYTCYMIIISNCPMGVELFMRVSTNYKQLQTIYFQRKHHRLREDWGAFCKFIEELPYAKELIIGETTA